MRCDPVAYPRDPAEGTPYGAGSAYRGDLSRHMVGDRVPPVNAIVRLILAGEPRSLAGASLADRVRGAHNAVPIWRDTCRSAVGSSAVIA